LNKKTTTIDSNKKTTTIDLNKKTTIDLNKKTIPVHKFHDIFHISLCGTVPVLNIKPVPGTSRTFCSITCYRGLFFTSTAIFLFFKSFTFAFSLLPLPVPVPVPNTDVAFPSQYQYQCTARHFLPHNPILPCHFNS